MTPEILQKCYSTQSCYVQRNGIPRVELVQLINAMDRTAAVLLNVDPRRLVATRIFDDHGLIVIERYYEDRAVHQ
jgi:hypothetical protein